MHEGSVPDFDLNNPVRQDYRFHMASSKFRCSSGLKKKIADTRAQRSTLIKIAVIVLGEEVQANLFVANFPWKGAAEITFQGLMISANSHEC